MHRMTKEKALSPRTVLLEYQRLSRDKLGAAPRVQFHGYRLSAHEQAKAPTQVSPPRSHKVSFDLIGSGEGGRDQAHKGLDPFQGSHEARNPFRTHRHSDSNSRSGEGLPFAANTLFPQIQAFHKTMGATNPPGGFRGLQAFGPKHGPVSNHALSAAASESGRKHTKKRVEAEATLSSGKTSGTHFKTDRAEAPPKPELLRRGQWYKFGRESPRDQPQ